MPGIKIDSPGLKAILSISFILVVAIGSPSCRPSLQTQTPPPPQNLTATPQVTHPVLPTPSPDLSSYLSHAAQVCDALFSTSASGIDTQSFPSMVLVKTIYSDSIAWRFADFDFPHQESWNPAKKYILCIVEDRIDKGNYSDGEPGYQIVWDARLLSMPDSNVSEKKVYGELPPGVKKHSGPAYGAQPNLELAQWLGILLAPKSIFYTGGSIVNFVYTPQEKLFLAVYDEFELTIVDADTGQALGIERNVSVKEAIFSPDGRLVATADIDNLIKLWDIEGLKEKLSLSGHTKDIYALAFSPDGKILASGGLDGSIRLWDVISGKEIRTLKVQSASNLNSVFSLAFSPQGTLLASGGPSDLIIWDIASGQKTIQINTEYIKALAFSPAGDLLASGMVGSAEEISLWDVATGKNLFSTQWTGGVSALAFSPDGKNLTSGHGSNYNEIFVDLWDVVTWQKIRRFTGHQDKITGLAFLKNGNGLFSSSLDGTLRFWDLGK